MPLKRIALLSVGDVIVPNCPLIDSGSPTSFAPINSDVAQGEIFRDRVTEILAVSGTALAATVVLRDR